jgi:hypothetical protein
MSIISNHMSTANAVVATAKGELLAYRTAIGTGTWVNLPGFVLDRDELGDPTQNDMQGAEEAGSVARVTGPLTPALAVGYGIRDGSGAEWAVRRVDFDQMQILTVERVTLGYAGVGRGHAG